MPARGGRFGSFCSFSVNLTFLQLKSLNVSPQRGRKRGSFKKAHRPHWTVYHHLKHINADFLSMTFPDSLILPCMIIISWTISIEDLLQADAKNIWPQPRNSSGATPDFSFPMVTLIYLAVCLLSMGTHSSFCSGFGLPSHHCMSSSRNQPTSAPTHQTNHNKSKQQYNSLELWFVKNHRTKELHSLVLSFYYYLCLCACCVFGRASCWGSG